MAHFLRAKQAGIDRDFSANIHSDLFALDDVARIGISSQISQIAYDPVQSLLAVGTRSTKFGPGQVYIFGQKRIEAVFPLPRQGASVRELQFCSDRLVVLDSRNDIGILSLPEKRWMGTYSPPGVVTVIASDPTLDYVMVGLQNGEILAYDIDRETIVPGYRIPNLWQEYNPRNRASPVVTMQFHPRDIGKLLIGYEAGVAIYSFKKDAPRQFFQYHVPSGAPGGDSDPSSMQMPRYPKLLHALWHPTGTFILTGHEDSSIVIWDPKDGRIIKARTLSETNVDQPGGVAPLDKGQHAPSTPLLKIAWCANQDPDDTALLIAGGATAMMPAKGLTLMELGRTPTYATSTWQLLSDHFENPKKQRILPTPPGVEVVNFCLIPRKSPWFAGSHDPIAVIAVLSSGEILTLSFPSGYPVSPTNQLHLSTTLVHPFVGKIAHHQLDRGKWLGMTESRQSGPPLLRGGAEAPRPLKRFESRSIISTAHADGTVRLWDMGHSDQIENDLVLQADVARAAGRLDGIQITEMALSGASSELAVGLRNGEVAIFRWGRNPHPGRESRDAGPNKPGALTNIVERRDPSLTEGFHPFTLLSTDSGPCTALKVSDVGFIAAGFESGMLYIIDMRGPAIIFNTNIKDISKNEKSGLLNKRRPSASIPDWATTLEFSVMTLEDDNYSSILLHAGTQQGAVITLKIIPDQRGRYEAHPAGSAPCEGRVLTIYPMHISSGDPASATPTVVSNLRNGIKIDGTLLVITKSSAYIFRPPAGKGAHKTWDAGGLCEQAAVTHCHDAGKALVCLFRDGTARSYTLPGLKEVASIRVDGVLDIRRLSDAITTGAGEVVGWTGPSEIAVLNVWGTGESRESRVKDDLFDPRLLIPPRPTISNFQWVSGTQYITPSDIDLLISGPGRPPAKRAQAQARNDQLAHQSESMASTSQSGAARVQSQSAETWGAYLSRNVTERTQNLSLMGDKMNALEDSSQGWAEDVNKFVSRQKKAAVMGLVKGRLGL